jgi:hypothetical protein
MELSEQPLAVKNVVQFRLYVVVHEHWPVSQCMIDLTRVATVSLGAKKGAE